jgi:hypothetical protein
LKDKGIDEYLESYDERDGDSDTLESGYFWGYILLGMRCLEIEKATELYKSQYSRDSVLSGQPLPGEGQKVLALD